MLAEEESDIRLPMAPAALAVARARRADAALRSRTADDLYWLGRNVERLDAGARQLLAAQRRLASGGLSARDRAELGRLAAALVRTGWISASLAAAPMDGAMFRDGVSVAAAGGEMMRRTLAAIRRLTLAARDQLSIDMWHVLHQLTGPTAARLAAAPYDPDRLLEALDGSIATVAAFAGLVAENMTRGAGWRFLDLGRRIERGIAVAQAVHGVMSGPVAQSEAGVRLALELCDSTNAYLLRYPAEARFARALEFVLTERNNPRALLYQLDRIESHLSAQAHLGMAQIEPALLLPLIARVEEFPLEGAHPDGGAAELAALLDLLDGVAGELLALSDAITRAFFTHVASACLVGFTSRPQLADVRDMRRYAVRHETRYGYEAPVDLGFHLLRLTPLDTKRQRVLAHALAISPEPTRVRNFSDHFGNAVHHVEVEVTHDHLAVTLEATVEVAGGNGLAAGGPAWETVCQAMRGDGFPSPPAVAEFVFPSPLAAPVEAASDYARPSFTAGRPLPEALRELTRRIHADFVYQTNLTNVSTQVSEVIAMRRGVCQDFAHVMIAGLRGLGLPARYVSGYIRTPGAEGNGGQPLVGAGASHAWVAAWCGEAIGWLELDPTNDRVVTDEHVAVAYGRDFSDVTPLRGVILGGGSHSLKVAVSVAEQVLPVA